MLHPFVSASVIATFDGCCQGNHPRKASDGSKALVDHPRRLKPGWTVDGKGFVGLTVRSGFETLEFEKGKAAVVRPCEEIDSAVSE